MIIYEFSQLKRFQILLSIILNNLETFIKIYLLINDITISINGLPQLNSAKKLGRYPILRNINTYTR